VPSVKTGCLELAIKIIGLHSSHTSMCSAVFPPFPPPIRFDYEALDDNYRVRITNKFAYLLLCEEEWLADDLWNAGKEIIIRIAAEQLTREQRNIPLGSLMKHLKKLRSEERLNQEDLTVQ